MEPVAAKAVFLSYASQDAEAARRIADALRAFGVEVWFDQQELRGGDAWDQKIRKQIHDCTLFVPVISNTTQQRGEGYFRREWRLAVDRTQDLAEGMPFIVPVVVDEIAENAAAVPEQFLHVQWTRLPRGVPSPQFVEQVKRLLDAPRTPIPVLRSAGPHALSRSAVSSLPAATPSAAANSGRPNGGIGHAESSGVPGPATSRAPRLRYATAFLIFAIVLTGGIGWWLLRDRVTPPNSGKAAARITSLAVKPLDDFSGDKSQSHLSDGMTEALCSTLGSLSALRVPGRASVMRFKGGQAPPMPSPRPCLTAPTRPLRVRRSFRR